MSEILDLFRRDNVPEIVDRELTWALHHELVTCCSTVTRNGELDACGKPAVGFVTGREWDEGWADGYPACSWHLNRYGGHLLKDVLLAAAAVGFDAGVSHGRNYTYHDANQPPNPYRKAKK